MKKTILLTGIVALSATLLHATPRPPATVLAKVNGKAITAGELTDMLWWQHGAQGLSDLIDNKLLLDEGTRLGIKADPKEVAARVTALASNYTDKAQFEKNLKSVGWTEADLKELLANQLIIRETVMTAKKITVSDEDIQKFFDANKEKLATPESVKLGQIYVNSQADADAALEALDVGADFGKLSALKSTDANLKKNGGELGWVNKGTLMPDLEKAIFALSAGQHTKPMATGSGYSIFMVEDHKDSQPAVLEKIKGDLKIGLINQALVQKVPELAAELKKKAKIEVP